MSSIDSRDLAIGVAQIADGMRGTDITILDVGSTLAITDYFVIASGTSIRQLKAMSEEIVKALKRQGVQRLFMSGQQDGGWILIDFGEIVVHLFSRDARSHYQLEALWKDAEVLPWEGEETSVDTARREEDKSPFGG